MDAILFSVSAEYVRYANALLNSLEFAGPFDGWQFKVYILPHDDMISQTQWLHDIRHFPFQVEVLPPLDDAGRGVRQATQIERYFTLRKLGQKHDVVCLLDADMMVVSRNFDNLFNMVRGTKLAIGSNERCKWTMTEHYKMDGGLLFDPPVALKKFHCNVPLIFRPALWDDVLIRYEEVVTRAREHRKGKGPLPIGDMFSWNVAVQQCRRANDVVLFPMETMTQVHSTGYRDWTQLKRDKDGYWYTSAGDEVFTLHGKPPFFKIEDHFEEQGIKEATARHVMGLVTDHWNFLNTQCRVKV